MLVSFGFKKIRPRSTFCMHAFPSGTAFIPGMHENLSDKLDEEVEYVNMEV